MVDFVFIDTYKIVGYNSLNNKNRGEIMSDEMDIILLYDEDGNETEFEVVATLEVEDNEYAILLPRDDERDPEAEEVDEAYILRIEQDENGEDILIGIDDEEELNMVIEAYEDLVKEESN